MRNSPTAAEPHTPKNRSTAAGTNDSNASGGSSISPQSVTFDPSSSADRELVRAAGMRIDTPTPYPRLLLEPHLTVELDRAQFASSPAQLDRTIDALFAHHGGSKLRIKTVDSSDANIDPEEAAWIERRRQARIHRAANPISIASTRGAFAASIAGPPSQDLPSSGRSSSSSSDPTAQVLLPGDYRATASRYISRPAADAWLRNERTRDAPLPIFVYGHWQIPTQLAAAANDYDTAHPPPTWHGNPQPTKEATTKWLRRMVPATLYNDIVDGESTAAATRAPRTPPDASAVDDDDGDAAATTQSSIDWHRYCMRGRLPTAAVLDRGNSTRLRYYLRDVGSDRHGGDGDDDPASSGVKGRLALTVTRETWAALDAHLGVGCPGEAQLWGKREVQVGVPVAGGRRLLRLRALMYVWEGDPMDLHIFKQDKVWTPELYVQGHDRAWEEIEARGLDGFAQLIDEDEAAAARAAGAGPGGRSG